MKAIRVSGTETRSALAGFLHEAMVGSALITVEPHEESAAAGLLGDEERHWVEPGWERPPVFEQSSVFIMDTNVDLKGTKEMVVFVSDILPGELAGDLRAVGWDADVALFEVPRDRAAGLEKEAKETMRVRKVLIYDDAEGRERAFRKVLDLALAYVGGTAVEGEVPKEVMEAVRAAAVDNRITCERAHALADELGVEKAVVGRALDLSDIKITECQLGCF
jgi:hypothetical protein